MIIAHGRLGLHQGLSLSTQHTAHEQQQYLIAVRITKAPAALPSHNQPLEISAQPVVSAARMARMHVSCPVMSAQHPAWQAPAATIVFQMRTIWQRAGKQAYYWNPAKTLQGSALLCSHLLGLLQHLQDFAIVPKALLHMHRLDAAVALAHHQQPTQDGALACRRSNSGSATAGSMWDP